MVARELPEMKRKSPCQMVFRRWVCVDTRGRMLHSSDSALEAALIGQMGADIEVVPLQL